MKLSTALFFLAYVEALNEEELPHKQKLTLANRHLRDKRNPLCALRYCKDSSFRFLYESMNDQALVNMTGFDHHSFNLLLTIFTPYYNAYTYSRLTGQVVPVQKNTGNMYCNFIDSNIDQFFLN